MPRMGAGLCRLFLEHYPLRAFANGHEVVDEPFHGFLEILFRERVVACFRE
jgi:hypothetical protein